MQQKLYTLHYIPPSIRICNPRLLNPAVASISIDKVCHCVHIVVYNETVSLSEKVTYHNLSLCVMLSIE